MQKTIRKSIVVVAIAALSGACASTQEAQTEVNNNDAIDDYIKVAELEQIDAIRSFAHFNHKPISEYYDIVYDRRKSYLVTYRTPCRKDRHTNIKPDIRFDRSTLRAQLDSIRGCRISALYGVSDGQVKELIRLGQQT